MRAQTVFAGNLSPVKAALRHKPGRKMGLFGQQGLKFGNCGGKGLPGRAGQGYFPAAKLC